MANALNREGGLHHDAPIRTAGTALEDARAAMIMLHGRGASADDILTLAQELDQKSFAYLAPQAINSAWYPYSFLSSIERNEPWLTSALDLVETLVDKIVQAGHPRDRIILLGFSQGACLALEYVARSPRKYGGVIGLSGGLIGPPGANWGFSGSLERTPVFLGCSDVDPHVPQQRFLETVDVFQKLEAEVESQLYPGMGHTVNPDEITRVRRMMENLVAS